VSTDSYYAVDPIGAADEQDGDQDLECGNPECLHEQSVVTVEEYSHDTVTWSADWVCTKCGEENSRDGWYNPNNNF
jgi:hypothetical protein